MGVIVPPLIGEINERYMRQDRGKQRGYEEFFKFCVGFSVSFAEKIQILWQVVRKVKDTIKCLQNEENILNIKNCTVLFLIGTFRSISISTADLFNTLNILLNYSQRHQ